MSKIVYSKGLTTRLGHGPVRVPLHRKASVIFGLLFFNFMLVGAAIWKIHPEAFASYLPSAKAKTFDRSATGLPVPQGATGSPAAAGKSAATWGSPAVHPGGEERVRMDAISTHIHESYRIARSAADIIVDEAFKAAKSEGIEPLLLLAIIAQESRFNPIAESTAGALGLVQAMPEAHPEKINEMSGRSHILNIGDNIVLGARIFSEYYRTFNGDVPKALQQYNGALSDPNRNYAKKVLDIHKRFVKMAG